MRHTRKEPLVLHEDWIESQDEPPTATGVDAEDRYQWRTVVNTTTGQIVQLKLRDPYEASLTVVAATFYSDDGLSTQLIRGFPIGAIQAAYRERRQGRDTVLKRWAAADAPTPDELEALATEPIRRKQRDDKFYALVAIQYTKLGETTDQPTKTLAELNGTTVASSQRWLWEARKRGFLPPGRQGRRTKKRGQ